jgi:ubiquinone/menaquinone biosynthesis C-methylase UbiE
MHSLNVYSGGGCYKQANYGRPKFIFSAIGRRIKTFLRQARGRSNISLLDVGGASGEFCCYLNKILPDIHTTLLEPDRELLRLAQKNVPLTRSVSGNANNMRLFKSNCYDIATCFGVLSIFDDFRPALREIIRVTKRGGIIYIFNLFNPYPLDCLISYRAAGNKDKAWHSGLNLISKASYGAFLKKAGKVRHFSFEKFTLPFDLRPYRGDPVRSWTQMHNGKRIIINGIMPLNMEILTVYL